MPPNCHEIVTLVTTVVCWSKSQVIKDYNYRLLYHHVIVIWQLLVKNLADVTVLLLVTFDLMPANGSPKFLCIIKYNNYDCLANDNHCVIHTRVFYMYVYTCYGFIGKRKLSWCSHFLDISFKKGCSIWLLVHAILDFVLILIVYVPTPVAYEPLEKGLH